MVEGKLKRGSPSRDRVPRDRAVQLRRQPPRRGPRDRTPVRVLRWDGPPPDRSGGVRSQAPSASRSRQNSRGFPVRRRTERPGVTGRVTRCRGASAPYQHRVSGTGDKPRCKECETNERTSRELARELRSDLDWITIRAMEKDRTRRYGSASELAADLRR